MTLPGSESLESARPAFTVYRLLDLDGTEVAEHVRVDGPTGKRMYWRLPDRTLGLGGRAVTDLPLYGLHRLGLTSPDDPVYLAEGEKAADALARAGLLGLGTVTGASTTPSDPSLEVLAGRGVRLWPDNDPVGWAHMERIAQRLKDVAASMAFVDWREAPEHGDAADFLADRGAAEVLALPLVSAQLGDGDWAEGMSGTTSDGAFHAAHSPTSRGAKRNLPFRTARAVARDVPERVEWFVPGYIAAGAITELVGKIKAAGKTTWLTHAVRSIVTGAQFIGRETTRTGVIYLTEQSPTSFRVALARAGLLERDDVVVLFWRDTAGVRWTDIVDAAIAEAKRLGFGLLVIDTLPRFAGLRGDAENNAGDADEAMAPLQRAAADGLAIVVVRHERKSGGEVGDSGRGSSAFGGAVDVVLALKRGEGASRPTVRVLRALSRFDGTPDELVVELKDDGYIALGDEAAVAFSDARTRLLRDLPRSESAALSMNELEVRFKELSATTIERARDALMGEGSVLRSGKGKKGDPFRYWAPVPEPPGRFDPAPTDDEFGQNEMADAEPSGGAAEVAAGEADPRRDTPDYSTAFAKYVDESTGGMWARIDTARPS